MLSQKVTTTGTSTSSLVVFDQYQTPFNVSFVTLVTAPVSYNIEYTSDNVQTTTYTPATGNWNSAAGFIASTASGTGSFITPNIAARVNQLSGTGSVTATFIQAGGPRC